MERAITVIASITADDGCEWAVETALMLAAQASINEPGNEGYGVFRDGQSLLKFTVIENWANFAAMNDHRAGKAHKTLYDMLLTHATVERNVIYKIC